MSALQTNTSFPGAAWPPLTHRSPMTSSPGVTSSLSLWPGPRRSPSSEPRDADRGGKGRNPDNRSQMSDGVGGVWPESAERMRGCFLFMKVLFIFILKGRAIKSQPSSSGRMGYLSKYPVTFGKYICTPLTP